MKKTHILLLIGVAVVIGAGIWLWQWNSNDRFIAEVVYQCDNDKTITATYYEGPDAPPSGPGVPPVPIGSVDVSLNGDPAVKLRQTISASGIRYANSNESLVFWSKGDEALIMRNNEMDLEYTNCKAQ